MQETNCCLAQFTESEIISLDAGLRMDGLLALGLWDTVMIVFVQPTTMSNRNIRAHMELVLLFIPKPSQKVKRKQKVDQLSDVEQSCSDRIHLEPKVQIKYVNTKNQLADMLTKEVSQEMNGPNFFICSI